MVMLETDIDWAPDRRSLATACRCARIRRDAASVSSRNSATSAPVERVTHVVLGLVTLGQEVAREI
jgi:hypothetical protein